MSEQDIWDEVRQCRRTARRSAVDQALWEAWGWRLLALQAAHRERERLEEWDPDAQAGVDWDAWRLQAMARDPDGYLARARAILIRTAAAPLTGAEKASVAVLRALVEHEAGDHKEELRQAQTLADRAPRLHVAAMTLQRALRCSGLAPESGRRNRPLRATTLTTEVSRRDSMAVVGGAWDTPGG